MPGIGTGVPAPVAHQRKSGDNGGSQADNRSEIISCVRQQKLHASTWRGDADGKQLESKNNGRLARS